MAAEAFFTQVEVERGRRYHRPRYFALVANLAVGLGVTGALAAVRPDLGLRWWLEAPALAAVVVAAAGGAQAPLGFWIGHVRERRWGLSTQSVRGWASDGLKALAVGVVVSAALVTGLVGLARALPEAWPVGAAGAGAAFVAFLGFVAPVVLEPLFNRFEPLAEGELRTRLLRLAERAGAPARDVLVADASRRTRKLNAYVSGLGASRRIVVFDTLLERAPAGEVAVVVAHELAHRREGHVAKLTALGMAGAAVAVAFLWAALGDGAADPESVPAALLVLGALEIVGAPLFAVVARRYERVADRVALTLTEDPAGFESLFRRLATENVADLDPPAPIRLIATHPPIPERIATVHR